MHIVHQIAAGVHEHFMGRTGVTVDREACGDVVIEHRLTRRWLKCYFTPERIVLQTGVSDRVATVLRRLDYSDPTMLDQLDELYTSLERG